jgi:hypothetical protein
MKLRLSVCLKLSAYQLQLWPSFHSRRVPLSLMLEMRSSASVRYQKCSTLTIVLKCEPQPAALNEIVDMQCKGGPAGFRSEH